MENFQAISCMLLLFLLLSENACAFVVNIRNSAVASVSPSRLFQPRLFPAASKIRIQQSSRSSDSLDVIKEDNEWEGQEDAALIQLDSNSALADAPAASSGLTAETNTDVLSLWKRRLITHEDPLSIHKWCSLIYTLSATVLLGTAGTIGLSGALIPSATTNYFPEFLTPWAYTFFASNLIMCLASVRMSFIHRKGDLTARNAFLGTAVSSLFSGFFFLWSSPYAPDILQNNALVSQGSFATLCLLNAFFIMDTCLQVDTVVEGRRDRKREEGTPSLFWRDAMGYVLPIAWGLPVIGSTGYQVSFAHDREWFMNYCQYITDVTGIPFLSNTVYLQVLASLAASYGALFVTLRDKKLVTKNQELIGITVFSVPAMLWTIFVTAIFYQNL